MTKGSVFSTTHSFSKGKLLILACFVHRQVKMPWQGTRTSILGRRTLRSWAMTLFPLRATWASVLGPVPPGILSLPFFTINLIQPWFVINHSHFHFSHYPPTCSLDEGENLLECSQPRCTSQSWFFSPWLNMSSVGLFPPCSHTSSMTVEDLTDRTGRASVGSVFQN